MCGPVYIGWWSTHTFYLSFPLDSWSQSLPLYPDGTDLAGQPQEIAWDYRCAPLCPAFFIPLLLSNLYMYTMKGELNYFQLLSYPRHAPQASCSCLFKIKTLKNPLSPVSAASVRGCKAGQGCPFFSMLPLAMWPPLHSFPRWVWDSRGIAIMQQPILLTWGNGAEVTGLEEVTGLAKGWQWIPVHLLIHSPQAVSHYRNERTGI